MSTRVLHGLNIASTYFQSTTPTVYDSMKHVINAWIVDFTIDVITGSKMLDHLDECFTNCGKTHQVPFRKEVRTLYHEIQVVRMLYR